MIQCPKCQTSFEADFGMHPCPGCKSIVFVDMEGGASINNETPQPFSQSYHENQTATESQESAESSYNFSEPMTHNEPPASEEVQIEESEASFSSEPDPIEITSDSINSAPSEEETSSIPMNFNDVVDYANSSSSSAATGLLTYSLFIEGIDTAEIRKHLIDALDDRRFLWNTDELIQNIEMGKLEIKNINAIKASILVNRLKSLPLEIRWTQYAITQNENH